MHQVNFRRQLKRSLKFGILLITVCFGFVIASVIAGLIAGVAVVSSLPPNPIFFVIQEILSDIPGIFGLALVSRYLFRSCEAVSCFLATIVATGCLIFADRFTDFIADADQGEAFPWRTILGALYFGLAAALTAHFLRLRPTFPPPAYQEAVS